MIEMQDPTADPPLMIPIKIKRGARGRARFPGVGSSLDGAIRLMDASMTWAEALRTHYSGLVVDPARFSIRRQESTVKWPRHNLTEQISVLLAEYRYPRNPFIVNLVEKREDRARAPRSRRGPRARRLPCLAPRLPPPQPQPSVSRVTSNSKSRPAAASGPAINTGIGNYGYFVPKQGGGRPKRSTPTPTATKKFVRKETAAPIKRVKFPEKHFLLGNDDGDESSANSSYGMPTLMNFNQDNYGDENEDNENVEIDVENYDENGGENEDAQSNASNESQDSQIEDLVDLGIPIQDLKGSFCRKAEKNISNSQFLKAKHELEELKRDFGQRWTKWTSYTPATANLIRDLFEV